MPEDKVRDGGGGGKWRLDADGDICSADGRLVACPCYDEDVWAIEEARRNARLIAASRKMAEALRRLVYHYALSQGLRRSTAFALMQGKWVDDAPDHVHPTLEEARAALALALAEGAAG